MAILASTERTSFYTAFPNVIPRVPFKSILLAILLVANSAVFGYCTDILFVCAECTGGVHRAPTRG